MNWYKVASGVVKRNADGFEYIEDNTPYPEDDIADVADTVCVMLDIPVSSISVEMGMKRVDLGIDISGMSTGRKRELQTALRRLPLAIQEKLPGWRVSWS
jgi:hypothetical protein